MAETTFNPSKEIIVTNKIKVTFFVMIVIGTGYAYKRRDKKSQILIESIATLWLFVVSFL